jgi:hypothetical protein
VRQYWEHCGVRLDAQGEPIITERAKDGAVRGLLLLRVYCSESRFQSVLQVAPALFHNNQVQCKNPQLMALLGLA